MLFIYCIPVLGALLFNFYVYYPKHDLLRGVVMALNSILLNSFPQLLPSSTYFWYFYDIF